MNVRELRNQAFLTLSAALQELSPEVLRLEADLLICSVLKLSREQLFSRGDLPVSEKQRELLAALLNRRKAREPIAYILGEKEFYSYTFKVSPKVLVPRPETELLVDAVLNSMSQCRSENGWFVCEVGVGSGAVLFSIMLESKKRFSEEMYRKSLFVGTDISRCALGIAQENAIRLSLAGQVLLVQGTLCQAISEKMFANRASIVVSNPPYVRHGEVLPRDVQDYEPPEALFAGASGLDCLKALIRENAPLLRAQKLQRLILEFGLNQHHEVECQLKAQGLQNFQFLQDLQGIVRAVIIRA